MQRSDVEFGNGRRVCVIGAGIAGLVTAKVLRDDGFEVMVFEKLPAIGGVWAASRTYPGLRTNSTRDTYAFSDFPYPETADEYPTAAQVRQYLDAYVEHFHLRPLLRLATDVRTVSRIPACGGDSQPAFAVTVRSSHGSRRQTRVPCDFVAVCNGVFSEPFVPAIDGHERFAGTVLHSSEVTSPKLLAGRRITVVGGGKSALDCAAWAARHGGAAMLVCRSPHWMVPRHFLGRIRSDAVISTRAFELFTRYHTLSAFESFLHGPANGIVRLWWQLQTRLLRRSLGMPKDLVPDDPLPGGLENVGIGVEFYDALRTGRLVARRARVREFAGPTTLVLDNDERVETDVLIFATGWRQSTDLLSPDLRDEVFRAGRFHLHRHILSAREPRLGFIGYASSAACQLTAEIGAHWLSQCFRGELRLLSPLAMEREIAHVHAWLDETFPARNEGYFIGQFVTHYIDELMRDMRLEPLRTRHFIREYFAPLRPSRYRDVGEARRRARRFSSGMPQSPEVVARAPAIALPFAAFSHGYKVQRTQPTQRMATLRGKGRPIDE